MSGLNYEEAMMWNVDDVLYWLEKNNFSEFSTVVSSEKIDGPDFIKLDKGRISSWKAVPKAKREALVKRLKELEKEKIKKQKSAKGDPKNRSAAPVVNGPPPPLTVRGAAPQPEDDGDENFVDDEDWDDDQGVYDNDEVLQPTTERRNGPPPPPPPPDQDSDEDYVVPDELDPPPSGSPPVPAPEDDDNLYERANQATIPPKNCQPSWNSTAPTQRAVPPPPAQGPNVPPLRGGRVPVAPPHEPILYEETESIPAPAPVRGRAPVPVPHPDPEEEMYEETDQVSLPLNQSPPPIPPSSGSKQSRAPPPLPEEIYEETDQDQDSEVQPEYESVDELKAKINKAPVPARGRAPVPVIHPDPEEELYEETDHVDEEIDQPPTPPTVRRPPSISAAVSNYGGKEKFQNPTPVSSRGRPPVPVPPSDPEETYEETDQMQVPVPPDRFGTSTPPSKSADDDIYEATDEQNIPAPPAPAISLNAKRPRPAPPLPADDPSEETNELPQMSRKREVDPPKKIDKLQIEKKVCAGMPAVGIPVNSLAVREAMQRLRPAIPKDFDEGKTTTATPNSQPEAVKGVGGIRDMFEKTKSQPPAVLPKQKPAGPLVSKTPVVHLPHQTTESNAPGAPASSKRRQERAPLPGPPGAPPEIGPAAVPDPNDIATQPWYFGDCDREKANEMLKNSKEEGTFLVRDSKGSGQPYTLCILYRRDTFNISIRKRPDGKYALGTEKPDEHVFETIYDMIRFHRNNAIDITKKGTPSGRVKLTRVAEK